MFLLLPTDHCSRGDHPHGDDDLTSSRPASERSRRRWHDRLLRCVQQMAVYLGDGYLAAEGCRGDFLCVAPEYFDDAIEASRQRRHLRG